MNIKKDQNQAEKKPHISEQNAQPIEWTFIFSHDDLHWTI